jgi:acid phosphatase
MLKMWNNNVLTMMLFTLLTTSASASALEPVTVVSIGDWGGASLGGYHLKNVQQTASAIDAQHSAFVINTGDSFYYCGIENTSDPQISEDYLNLFQGKVAQVPWYSALGNHDYGFSPDAQLELNKVIPAWVMDARYYWRPIAVTPTVGVNLIVLDTNPCIRDYRSPDPVKWDPCGTEFPTCAPQTGECRFHENIIAQECAPQLEWFKTVLDQIHQNQIQIQNQNWWTIVVGHHPANEINVDTNNNASTTTTDSFQSLLDRDDVHLYINGHVHLLEHYAINNQAKYVTTGAASMVFKNDVDNKKKPTNKVTKVWSKTVTGYTLHKFISNATLVTEYLDSYTNELIYSFSIDKQNKQK